MKAIITVIGLSLVWFTLFVSFGIFSGWLTITGVDPWLINPAAFLYKHLRLSMVPFGLLFILYFFLINRVQLCLHQDGPDQLARLSYYDRLLNTVISTFFGVGVIWTAVGMEGALVQALDSVGPASGAIQSPAELLNRLVNGGLLLALSTTIFGGVFGYLLRMMKIVLLGKDWDRLVLGGTSND